MVPLRPGNAGGGKDPDFWRAFDGGEDEVIGGEPANTRTDPEPPEEAVSQGEGGAGLPLLPARVFSQTTQALVEAKPVTLNGGGLQPLIKDAVRLAQRTANAREPQMFAPPIAGVSPEKPRDDWRAREVDLKEGYSISVECDEKPARARRKLEAVLGAAT